jgi:hypothetical protein
MERKDVPPSGIGTGATQMPADKAPPRGALTGIAGGHERVIVEQPGAEPKPDSVDPVEKPPVAKPVEKPLY